MNNSSESGSNVQLNVSVCSITGTEPVAVRWTKTVVYLLLLALALFGNALVIWIVYKNRRMRTAPNLLIVNMACYSLQRYINSNIVGDLLVAITAMIPTAVSFIQDTSTWPIDPPFGQIFCKLLNISQGSSIGCSIFSLVVLAFERFFVVVFPTRNIVTIRGTLWSIAAIWVFSLSLSLPLLYAAKVRIYDGVSFCIEDWSPAFDPIRAPGIYTIVSFVFLYAFPLLVITVLYTVIAAKVWGRTSPGNVSNRRVLQAAKKNVLKMSVAVVLVFAICWVLIHVYLFLTYFSVVFEPCGAPSVWLQTTGFLFGHANSAINCCIYPLFSQEYRQAYKKCFKSLIAKCQANVTPPSERAADIPLEDRIIN